MTEPDTLTFSAIAARLERGGLAPLVERLRRDAETGVPPSPWLGFFRRNHAVLARANADWPVARVFLQLALDAPEETIRAEATRWLTEHRADWPLCRSETSIALPAGVRSVFEAPSGTVAAVCPRCSWAGAPDCVALADDEGNVLVHDAAHGLPVFGAKLGARFELSSLRPAGADRLVAFGSLGIALVDADGAGPVIRPPDGWHAFLDAAWLPESGSILAVVARMYQWNPVRGTGRSAERTRLLVRYAKDGTQLESVHMDGSPTQLLPLGGNRVLGWSDADAFIALEFPGARPVAAPRPPSVEGDGRPLPDFYVNASVARDGMAYLNFGVLGDYEGTDSGLAGRWVRVDPQTFVVSETDAALAAELDTYDLPMSRVMQSDGILFILERPRLLRSVVASEDLPRKPAETLIGSETSFTLRRSFASDAPGGGTVELIGAEGAEIASWPVTTAPAVFLEALGYAPGTVRPLHCLLEEKPCGFALIDPDTRATLTEWHAPFPVGARLEDDGTVTVSRTGEAIIPDAADPITSFRIRVEWPAGTNQPQPPREAFHGSAAEIAKRLEADAKATSRYWLARAKAEFERLFAAGAADDSDDIFAPKRRPSVPKDAEARVSALLERARALDPSLSPALLLLAKLKAERYRDAYDGLPASGQDGKTLTRESGVVEKTKFIVSELASGSPRAEAWSCLLGLVDRTDETCWRLELDAPTKLLEWAASRFELPLPELVFHLGLAAIADRAEPARGLELVGRARERGFYPPNAPFYEALARFRLGDVDGAARSLEAYETSCWQEATLADAVRLPQRLRPVSEALVGLLAAGDAWLIGLDVLDGLDDAGARRGLALFETVRARRPLRSALEFRCYEGLLSRNDGVTDARLAALDGAVGLDPHDRSLRLERAKLRASLGSFEDAAEDYEAFLDFADPRDPGVSGDDALAAPEFASFLGRAPFVPPARDAVEVEDTTDDGSYLSGMFGDSPAPVPPPDESETGNDLAERVQAAMDSGNKAAALALLESAGIGIDADPGLLFLHGWLLHNVRGELRAALEKLDAAAGANADDEQVLYERACVRALLGDEEGALDDLERYVKVQGASEERAAELFGDDEFASLRAEPRFVVLVAGTPFDPDALADPVLAVRLIDWLDALANAPLGPEHRRALAAVEKTLRAAGWSN